jgi:hypothetical protein
MRYGVVTSFNSSKGIGNIKDNTKNEEYTFLKADCPHEVEIFDEVAYELLTVDNKTTAVKVKLA